MPIEASPICLPNIIIGTYRIIQLPIIPILPLQSKSNKYNNIKSKYLINNYIKNTNNNDNNPLKKMEKEWKKINGS